MNSTIQHEKALRAIQQGNHHLAISSFEKALAVSPDSSKLLIDYAQFLKCLYRYDTALELVARVSKEAPSDAHMIHTMAEISIQCRDPQGALKYLERATNDPGCLYKAAQLLERVGDLSGAADHLLLAEKLGGVTLTSELLKAQLLQRSNESSKSLEILENLIKVTPRNSQTRPMVYYLKGKVLDGIGEYSDAYASWHEAKKLLIPQSEQTLELSSRRLETYKHCVDRLTESDIQRWKEWQQPQGGPQPIMVTGYPRSGTTLLEHCISTDLDIPSADENKAFGDMLWRTASSCEKNGAVLWRSINKENLHVAKEKQFLESYQQALASLAKADSDGAWILDKNPQLLINLPVMLRLIPRMPVVVIHRDPRDVMLSCFSMPFGLNPHSVHYLSFQSLAENLALMRTVADKMKHVLGDQMVVCHYEKLVSNPQVERKHLADQIMQTTSDLKFNYGDHTSSRVSYSPSYADVAKPLYKNSINRWENYKEWIEPHLEPLQPWLE